jgi:predicted transcriptional regulator YheO
MKTQRVINRAIQVTETLLCINLSIQSIPHVKLFIKILGVMTLTVDEEKEMKEKVA